MNDEIYIDSISFDKGINLTYWNLSKIFSGKWIDFGQVKYFVSYCAETVPKFDQVVIKRVPGHGIVLQFLKDDGPRTVLFVPGYAWTEHSDDIVLNVSLPDWTKNEYDVATYT